MRYSLLAKYRGLLFETNDLKGKPYTTVTDPPEGFPIRQTWLDQMGAAPVSPPNEVVVEPAPGPALYGDGLYGEGLYG